MEVRIFSVETFGTGCGYQVCVGRYKDQRGKASSSEGLVSDQSRSKLHSIIATQFMVQGQIDSPVNSGTIDCYQLVVGHAVTQKEGYCIIAFFHSDTARSAVFGGDCGSDLGERDFAEDNGVSSPGISQRFDPSGASFWTVTFNYSAGVQITMAHLLGPRCSRMISLSGFPPTRAREASTSSKRTCLSPYLCSRRLCSTNNP